jgi:Phosphomannomutase
MLEELITSGNYSNGRGRVLYEPSARRLYAERTAKLADCDFSGKKICLDCCFGATVGLAEEIFSMLGAKVVALCNEPDGRRVNVGCGSTNVDFLLGKAGAEHGYAFDGDGDRVIGVDNGRTYGGDCFLYVLSDDLTRRGLLYPKTVVGTKMTNGSLIFELQKKGIEFNAASVGDKYVLKEMQKKRRGARRRRIGAYNRKKRNNDGRWNTCGSTIRAGKAFWRLSREV